MLAMAVSDWSSQVWLQGFNEVGETIFGMSADAMMDLKVHFLQLRIPIF